MLGTGGVNLSLLRAVSEHAGDRELTGSIVRGAIAPTLALAAAFGTLFALAAPLCARLLDSEAVAFGMRSAAPGLFFFSLNKCLFGILNGLQRMRSFALLSAARHLLLAGFVVAGIALPIDGALLPCAFSLGEGLLFAALGIEVSRRIPWWRARGAAVWRRRHLGYGLRGFLSSVLLEINWQVDVLMLGYFASDAPVGIYSFATFVLVGIHQIVFVLQNNYNPVLAQMLASGRRDELEAVIRRGRWTAHAILSATCGLAFLLYPWAVDWIVGDPDFAAGRRPFAILAFGLVLASGHLTFFNVLLMGNRPTHHTLYVLATVAANALGNYLLIPRFGLEGAALATASAFVFSAALLRWIARASLALRL